MGQDLAGCGAAPRGDSKAGTASARRVHGDLVAVRTGQLPGGTACAHTHVRADRATAAVPQDATAVNALIHAAAELQAVCEANRWRFCFIGGLAVQRWGEPRETVDVDLTLLTGFADEARFVSVLMSTFESRIDNAANFARVNPVIARILRPLRLSSEIPKPCHARAPPLPLDAGMCPVGDDAITLEPC